jgi:alpha-ribazole phosphatase
MTTRRGEPAENRVLYLVRHGKIRQEDDQRRYIGQIDVPLAEEGRRQAEHLRRRMAHAEIGAAYCSDLTRSRETAEIAAGGRFEIVARPDLREISMGKWEGRTLGEVARQFPEAYKARGEDIAGFRVPGGESFVECSRRAVSAFEDIMARTTGNVLVIGHAGVNRLILCHLLGMPVENLFRIGQDYSCLNIIQASNSGYQVRLVNGRARSGGR